MPKIKPRTSESKYRFHRAGWILLLAFFSWNLISSPAMADNGVLPFPQMREIRFAATQGLYPNLSRKDGRMALELLMRKTIVRKKYPYAVELTFIDPVHPIPGAVEKGGYHFVTLSSIDFYKYSDVIRLNPILTPSKIDTPTEQLMLLVDAEQELSTILQKEERSLIIEKGTNGDLSRIWLDHLLAKRGYPRSDRFFTKIRRVSKPGRAILPVFFKQADASIVTRHALDVIQELNPQIGRKVKALHQSEGLVRLMICATDKPSQEDIDILIRESTNMEHNPETRQAMTILQMKQFVRIFPDDLTATEKLISNHHQTEDRD